MKHFKLMKGVLACLLSLALVISSFGVTGLGFIASSASGESSESGTSTSGSGTSTSAEPTVTAAVSAKYDPNTDCVVFSSDEKVTVYYAVVGEKGKKLANGANKSDFKTVELTAAKPAATSTSGGSGESTSGGSTSGENTSLGAYTAYVSFEKSELNVKASKDAYIFYTAETPSTDKKDYSANLVVKGNPDKSKLTVEFNYYNAYEGSIVSAIGYAKKVLKKDISDVNVSDIIYRVYTVDKSANPATKVYSEWKSASELTGAEVAADVAKVSPKGSKISVTYFFKIKGIADTRGSAEVKVKVGKQGKATVAKIDYKKGTLSVKNGFDYAIISGSGAPTAADWVTVKPQNKTSGSGDATIATSEFVPTDKKFIEGSEIYFTKDKVSGLDVYELLGDKDEATIYVRKSATTKAPATEVSKGVKVAKTAEIVVPNDKIAGTLGKDKSGKDVAIPAEAIKTGYEYVVVTAEDVADISSLKWTEIKEKGIELAKAKTKISNTKTNKILKDSKLNEDVYVLIRKKGDAKTNALPSPYVWTKIYEEDATSTSGSGSSTSGGSTSGESTSGGSTSGESTSGGKTAEAKKGIVWKFVDAPVAEPETEETTEVEITITAPAEDADYTLVVLNGDKEVKTGAKVAKDTTLTIAVAPKAEKTISSVTMDGVTFEKNAETGEYTGTIKVGTKAITINPAVS